MTDENILTLPDGRELCWREEGQGMPLLMVIGLGMQMTGWQPELLAALKARGFRLILFDNRDVGRSSRIHRQKPPGVWRMLTRKTLPEEYDLGHMAEDAVALLDHLQLPAAHVVGMSMGGMIAQTIAARFPARVLSLSSIFSTTGARKVGQPGLRATLLLAAPPAKTKADAVRKYLKMIRHVAGRGHAADIDFHADYAGKAWDRGGPNPYAGVARQVMAILKSGDRTAELAQVTAPTVVIHGDRDPLVHPSGGRATAAAIPGAQLVEIEGMGHDLPEPIMGDIADIIARTAARAGARLLPGAPLSAGAAPVAP